MKQVSFKCLFAIASLCVVFGFGCRGPASGGGDEATVQQGENTEVQPQIGGGGSCPAHDNCYWLCRRIHNCGQDPNQCDPLSDCLNACDAEFPTCV